jgi:uroporphyrinogen-III synthase
MGQPPNLGHRQGKVWITRASPGAEATAERAGALGFACIIAPLLTFRSIAAEIRPRPGEALAFTSINGVVRTAAMTDRRDNRVFVVGDATAQAARAAGFSDVVSAAGDVQALAALIIRAAPTAVLHLCALQTAGDLVGALRAAGVEARKLAVYETAEKTDLPAAIRTALEHRTLSAILLHSPKAARTAAALLDWREKVLEAVVGIGLSSACIEPLRALPFEALIAAPQPTEDALMRALADFAARRRHG